MGKKSDLESVHLVNHSKCMLAAFQNFRQDETLLDVTLVCNGMSLKAHKLILSACSPLFKEILSENPCSHPVIVLRDFEFSDLRAIIEFAYKGELSVPRERLLSALKVAEELRIRGLKRSEPNREKYEKLYNQVRGKLSNRKKRKRRRHDSTDSEIKDCDSISEPEQNIVESDDETRIEPQPMEVESGIIEENSGHTKDIRPVVLRVGEPVTSNGQPISKDTNENEECNVIGSLEKSVSDDSSQKEILSADKEEIQVQICEPVLENAPASSQLDSFAVCSENSDVSLGCILPSAEQSMFQEQSTETMFEAESLEKGQSLSSPCLSPKSLDITQSEEIKVQDEGKRFICSKCDSSFTSRISFMKHKTLGHNCKEKGTYECKHCKFITEELDCFKNHLLIHSDKVPYKCSICPEEFTSEELYKNHASMHETEKVSLHGLLPASKQDLFSPQNIIPEQKVEFRCSICFIKFASKLRCQIHEKTCQGGS